MEIPPIKLNGLYVINRILTVRFSITLANLNYYNVGKRAAIPSGVIGDGGHGQFFGNFNSSEIYIIR